MSKEYKGPYLRLALFLLLMCILLGAMNRFFVKTDTSRYLMLRELQEKGNLDVLFVGSSPVYYGIDPEQVTKNTGLQAFDAAVGNMELPGAAAVSELALRTNDLKYVVLALEPATLLSTHESEEAEARIMPMLPPSIAWRYYLNLVRTDNRLLTRFFYFRTMPVDSFQDFMKTCTISFRTERYAEEMANNLVETPYRGRGYHEMLLEPQEGGLFLTRNFVPEEESSVEFPKETISLVRQIEEDCKAKGTQLIVMILPMPTAAVLYSPKLMDACDSLAAYCEAEGIPFVNATRPNPAWLPDLNAYFVDVYHLCSEGAAIFSNAVSEMIKKLEAGETISDLSCPSWERFLEESDRIYNVYASVGRENGNISVNAGCIAGDMATPRYRFEAETNGERVLLQDWSEAHTFFGEDEQLEGKTLIISAETMDGTSASALRIEL